ncbi:MAG: hypothetical protein MI749_07365 [Desulfovibrionales bacterium]|nr:hypothetical protein [Desulfovibrionales bacterium]
MINKGQNQPMDRPIILLVPMPDKGVGARAFRCDQYDKCLYKAAVQDWFSFNCENCHYPGKQGMDFVAPIIMPDFEDETPNGSTEVALGDLLPTNTIWETLQKEIAHHDRPA